MWAIPRVLDKVLIFFTKTIRWFYLIISDKIPSKLFSYFVFR